MVAQANSRLGILAGRLDIQARIGVLVVACLLPVCLYCVYLVVLAHDRSRAALEETLVAMARAQASILDKRLSSVEAALQALSVSPSIAARDWESFRTQADAVSRNLSALNAVLLDDKGAQLVNTLKPPGTPLPAMPPPFFARVKETGRPFRSDLFVGPVTGAPLVAFAQPVVRDGRFTNLVGLSMDVSQLGALLEEARFPTGWIAAILDSSGTIVARTHAADRYVGEKAVAPVVAAAKASPFGIVEAVTRDGVPTIAAWAVSQPSGWAVVVGAPTEVFESQLRASLIRTAALAVSALGIALVLARGLGRHISRPILGLLPLAAAVGRQEVVPVAPLGLSEADRVAEALANASNLLNQRTRERDQADDRASTLARLNAELEQFATVASHDLREPLRTISAYLSLIERRYGPALAGEGGEFLAFARDGANRLDRLILDLLDYSRLDRGGETMVPTTLDAVLDPALANLANAIDEAGAVVSSAAGAAEVGVQGDPGQLVRLFQNLVGNAIKYRAEDRSPRIRISWLRGGDHWEIRVADNGIGIEPQDFDRIFGIFQRLHGHAYQGTGIGLAVCKKIVERHGGRIWVESQRGKGSTFAFTLPAAH
jgi:signal transduction histidine kinase